MVIETIALDNIIPPVSPSWASARFAYSGLQINGNMEIDQEHAGAIVTVPPSQNLIDQLSLWSSGLSCTGQQVQDSPIGYRCSVKMTVTTGVPSPAATDAALFIHPLEGYRTARLMWGTSNAMPLSLAFWVKSNVAPSTFSMCFRNPPTYDPLFFTNLNISTPDVWEYKTLTIPGPTTGSWGSGSSVGMDFLTVFAAGSSRVSSSSNAWISSSGFAAPGITNYFATTGNYFQMTGLIIVPGIEIPNAAYAPLIQRPFDEELLACQRYWEKSYDYGAVPGTAATAGITGHIAAITAAMWQFVPWKIRKRVTPAVSTYSDSGTLGNVKNVTTGVAQASLPQYITDAGYVENTSGTAGHRYIWHWVANARM